jgi:hypothetical protein
MVSNGLMYMHLESPKEKENEVEEIKKKKVKIFFKITDKTPNPRP